jgi:hypothetical protein
VAVAIPNDDGIAQARCYSRGRQIRRTSVRNILLVAPVVSCAWIASLVPTHVQAEVVKLYCITKIYENGEPQFAVTDDMKFDFDNQTINDRPTLMSTENNIVSWKHHDSDVTTSSTLNKSTWDLSKEFIRSDGTRLQYIGTCSLNCSLFDTLPPLQRRPAYFYCR